MALRSISCISTLLKSVRPINSFQAAKEFAGHLRASKIKCDGFIEKSAFSGDQQDSHLNELLGKFTFVKRKEKLTGFKLTGQSVPGFKYVRIPLIGVEEQIDSATKLAICKQQMYPDGTRGIGDVNPHGPSSGDGPGVGGGKAGVSSAGSGKSTTKADPAGKGGVSGNGTPKPRPKPLPKPVKDPSVLEIGVQQCGNSCYAASMLQLIRTIDLVPTLDKVCPPPSKREAPHNVCGVLRDLLTKVESQAVSAASLFQELDKARHLVDPASEKTQFSRRRQECSYDFFASIFNYIDRERIFHLDIENQSFVATNFDLDTEYATITVKNKPWKDEYFFQDSVGIFLTEKYGNFAYKFRIDAIKSDTKETKITDMPSLKAAWKDHNCAGAGSCKMFREIVRVKTASTLSDCFTAQFGDVNWMKSFTVSSITRDDRTLVVTTMEQLKKVWGASGEPTQDVLNCEGAKCRLHLRVNSETNIPVKFREWPFDFIVTRAKTCQNERDGAKCGNTKPKAEKEQMILLTPPMTAAKMQEAELGRQLAENRKAGKKAKVKATGPLQVAASPKYPLWSVPVAFDNWKKDLGESLDGSPEDITCRCEACSKALGLGDNEEDHINTIHHNEFQSLNVKDTLVLYFKVFELDLKKFQANPNDPDPTRKVTQKDVRFDVPEVLTVDHDGGSSKYVLTAVQLHHGSTKNTGHYTARTRKSALKFSDSVDTTVWKDSDKWVDCNDKLMKATASPVDGFSPHNPGSTTVPYFVVYRREDKVIVN